MKQDDTRKLSHWLMDNDSWLSSLTVEEMSGDGIKAYLYLLCRQFDNQPELTLPSDDRKLARLAKVTPEKWARIKGEVLPNFKSDGNGKIYNVRMRETYTFGMQKVAAGRAGGNAKANKRARG